MRTSKNIGCCCCEKKREMITIDLSPQMMMMALSLEDKHKLSEKTDEAGIFSRGRLKISARK
jgi:hypothetical protein